MGDAVKPEPLRSASLGTTGVDGEFKNLISAANGPKPEIVLRDAVSNRLEIVRNAEYCLAPGRSPPPACHGHSSSAGGSRRTRPLLKRLGGGGQVR
ncbi:hypothetical protein [Streptomyces lavendulocolor]|uniref:hypothetical protein n=1 Tax=Streptomyces lavendulocolor TaxID=67316 RepID=UPI0031CE0926